MYRTQSTHPETALPSIPNYLPTRRLRRRLLPRPTAAPSALKHQPPPPLVTTGGALHASDLGSSTPSCAPPGEEAGGRGSACRWEGSHLARRRRPSPHLARRRRPSLLSGEPPCSSSISACDAQEDPTSAVLLRREGPRPMPRAAPRGRTSSSAAHRQGGPPRAASETPPARPVGEPLMCTTRFYSCRLVGPPSAEVCRTAANFP